MTAHTTDGSAALYGTAPVRVVNGTVRNVVQPYFQDVFVLRSGRAAWESSLVGVRRDAFALTLSTNSTLALVADRRFVVPYGHLGATTFVPGMSIALGGLTVRVSATWSTAALAALAGSAAGNASALAALAEEHGVPVDVLGAGVDVVVAQAPLFSSVFPPQCTAAGCLPSPGGYVPLALYNSDAPDGSLGGAVSCPPVCPGVADLPAEDLTAALVALHADSRPAVRSGVYYTPVCAGYPPPDNRCVEVVTAQSCAYGYADSCRQCPVGAFCPGGDRMWSQPGYWLADESSTHLRKCDFPARCLGWDVAAGAPRCATGYDARTPECASCVTAFYMDINHCVPCPSDSTDVVTIIVLFAAAVLALFLVMLAVVMMITRRHGGTISNGVFRSRDFVTWTLICWQTIVQVGHRSQFATPLLRDVYARMQIVELNPGAVVHPSCLTSKPFFTETVQLGVSVALCAATCVLHAVGTRRGVRVVGTRVDKRLGTVRRLCMSSLTLLYPLVANTALSMLYCKPSEDPNDEDAAVLASNPFVVCFAGDHTTPGVLAVCAVVLHVVGFPLATCVYVARALSAGSASVSGRRAGWQATWRSYLNGQYERPRYWFAQLNQAVLLTLAIAFVLGTAPSTFVQTTMFLVSGAVLSAHLAAFMWLRPYVRRKRWIQHVKCLTIVVALLGTLTNYVVFWEHRAGGAALERFAGVLSGALVVSFVVLVVVFVVAFVRSLLEGAAQEQQEVVRRKNVLGRTNPMFKLANRGASATQAAQAAPAVVPLALPVRAGTSNANRLSWGDVARGRRTSTAAQFKPLQVGRRSTDDVDTEHGSALTSLVRSVNPLRAALPRASPATPAGSLPGAAPMTPRMGHLSGYRTSQAGPSARQPGRRARGRR